MMNDLIAKLETATEGGRELDLLILVAVGHTNRRAAEMVAAGIHPLASIDAALTLVPEDWTLSELGELTGEFPWFALFRRRNMKITNNMIGVFARTPALAICIAILKARMK